LQGQISGFKLQIPGLEDHFFPPTTTVLLMGRPGVGKSVFTEQFVHNGLEQGQHAIYVATDTSADMVRRRFPSASELEVVDLFQEKPRLINDISIAVHQMITRLGKRPVRLVYDSLSTLGMLFKPDVLPPWVMDQRARFVRNNSNVIGLMVYATGIHPPTVSRSLQTLADVVLEMRFLEGEGEPKRLFRVFSIRGLSHSAKWYPFTIDDEGLKFEEPTL
jgi:KaiC/GvpD/RAD55 family RecA-like ATPase